MLLYYNVPHAISIVSWSDSEHLKILCSVLKKKSEKRLRSFSFAEKLRERTGKSRCRKRIRRSEILCPSVAGKNKNFSSPPTKRSEETDEVYGIEEKLSVSTEMCQTVSLELNISQADFKASLGWVRRFFAQYNICIRWRTTAE